MQIALHNDYQVIIKFLNNIMQIISNSFIYRYVQILIGLNINIYNDKYDHNNKLFYFQ